MQMKAEPAVTSRESAVICAIGVPPPATTAAPGMPSMMQTFPQPAPSCAA